jgi:hypothetical protein
MKFTHSKREPKSQVTTANRKIACLWQFLKIPEKLALGSAAAASSVRFASIQLRLLL